MENQNVFLRLHNEWDIAIKDSDNKAQLRSAAKKFTETRYDVLDRSWSSVKVIQRLWENTNTQGNKCS